MTDEERTHLEKVKENMGRCDKYGHYCKKCLIYKEFFAPKNSTGCACSNAYNAALKLLKAEEGVCESIW